MDKKILKIKWQRLVIDGETCPRCNETEQEIDKAVRVLKKSLDDLEIEVLVEKEVYPVSDFKENPLESNRIWINDKPIEEYLKANVGQSSCCDVCGPSECRTIEVDGQVYEKIDSDLIIKAGLLAVTEMLSDKKNKPCCGD